MKYAISVLLGAMSYGILSTIVVLSYGKGYDLGEVVGVQMLTGFMLSWGLAVFMRLRDRRKTAAGRAKSAAVAGSDAKLIWKQRLLLMAAGMPTAVTGLLYYESLRYIPASLAIILLFQFTWIGVLIQAVGERKRPSGVMFATLVVLFGGTLLASGIVEQGAGRLHVTGIVLGLLSAVSYSLFIWFSGKAMPGIRPAYRSVWMLAGGMTLVFILFPPEFLINGKLWSELLLYGFMLGLFGAFIPPVLFAVGVPRIGEGMAGIIGAAELPVAVLASSLVLQEHVSLLQWAGVVLVLVGVALPELAKRMSYGQQRKRAA